MSVKYGFIKDGLVMSIFESDDLPKDFANIKPFIVPVTDQVTCGDSYDGTTFTPHKDKKIDPNIVSVTSRKVDLFAISVLKALESSGILSSEQVQNALSNSFGEVVKLVDNPAIADTAVVPDEIL